MCRPVRDASAARSRSTSLAGGQLEHPSDVKSSTTAKPAWPESADAASATGVGALGRLQPTNVATVHTSHREAPENTGTLELRAAPGPGSVIRRTRGVKSKVETPPAARASIRAVPIHLPQP